MNNPDRISLWKLTASEKQISMEQDIAIAQLQDETYDDVNFPFRFDGLIIGLVSSGHGRIGIDLREYEIKPDTVLVIHPRNYVYYADGEDIAMDIVACSREVAENVLPKLTDVMPLLMHHRSEPVEELTHEDAESLREFYKFLHKEINGIQGPFHKKKMMSLLQAALFEMMDIQCHRQQVTRQYKTRKEEIMAKFILLVSENFREQRQVGFYSDQLCVTSKHLSAVVKEISGRTAGDWIENYVTVEAKVLLRSTDLTIQEIASRLNFSNQSFFGKYFKHQTGMSPTEYRKQEN